MTGKLGAAITGVLAIGLDPHDEHPTGAAPTHGAQAEWPAQQWANGRQQQHPADSCDANATAQDRRRERRGMVVVS